MMTINIGMNNNTTFITYKTITTMRTVLPYNIRQSELNLHCHTYSHTYMHTYIHLLTSPYNITIPLIPPHHYAYMYEHVNAYIHHSYIHACTYPVSVACADLAVDAVDGSLHGRVHQLEYPPQLSAAMAIQGHGLRLQSAHSQILDTQIHTYTLKVMQMMRFFNNAATICMYVCMYVCMYALPSFVRLQPIHSNLLFSS